MMKVSKPNQISLLDQAFVYADIDRLISYAQSLEIDLVEVPPLFIKPIKQKAPALKLVAPIGYPYGHTAIEAKLSETVLALVDGADEVEWRLNIQVIRSGDYQYVAKEISHFLPVVAKMGKKASLGLDVGLLNKDELNAICNIIGPASCYALHIFSDQSINLSSKIAQARVLLPDAIRIKADIVNNNQKEEILHADIFSLCCNLSDLPV